MCLKMSETKYAQLQMLGTKVIRANFFNEFREDLGLELSIRQKKIAQEVGY